MNKILVGVVPFAVMLTACSVNTNGGTLEQWINYDSKKITTADLRDDQALAVFYRDVNDVRKDVVNIYVDGDYHTSVFADAFTPVPVCASNVLLATSFGDSAWFAQRNQLKGSHYSVEPKSVAYFKILSDELGGQAKLVQVDENTANEDLKLLKGSVSHVLSRVNTDDSCDVKQAKANQVVQPVTAEMRGATMLFWNINQYRKADILPESKKELASFVSYVKQDKGNSIKYIEIAGHADPRGTSVYNQKLSERRAAEIRRSLEKSGVKAKITVVGYGETYPVVTNCKALHGNNKVLKDQCNQPNRRVEINVR